MPSITVQSFSYKRGVPEGADLVFDVRFLKNPHYEPSLTELTGRDAAAGEYIETDPQFALFFDYLQALVTEKLPRHLQDIKPELVIAIGCTGGRHRSVYVVEKLAAALRDKGHNVIIDHKELSYVR